MLEDIAILTNGTMISEDLGIELETVSLDMLVPPNAFLTKEESTVVAGAGKKKDIDGRCNQIRAQIEETTSDYDEEATRAPRKTFWRCRRIRVGGGAEVEVRERKDRVDDTLNATRAAVEEGIVPGGSTALLLAARSLKNLKPKNDDQRVGIDIVRRAIQAPPIAENAVLTVGNRW